MQAIFKLVSFAILSLSFFVDAFGENITPPRAIINKDGSILFEGPSGVFESSVLEKGPMYPVFEGTFKGIDNEGTVIIDFELYTDQLPTLARVKCTINHRTKGIVDMGLEMPKGIPDTVLTDGDFWIHNLLENNNIFRDINNRIGLPVKVTPTEKYCLRLVFLETDKATIKNKKEQLQKIEESSEAGKNSTLTLNEYLKQISRKISSSIRYPDNARRKRQEGLVKLKITIDKEGKLEHVELLASSGFSQIDQDALNTINRASPFGMFPEEVVQDSLTFVLPIRYKLQ